MPVAPAEAFLAALDSSLDVPAFPDLEARLEVAVQRGRAAWPEVKVDAAGFAAHLGRHFSERFEGLVIEDLYLAHACAMRDEAALRMLHQQLVPELDQALGRLALDADEADDVRLAVMKKLVVDEPPKIASYAGRGSLQQWIAAVAAREAIGRQRTAARRRGLLEAAVDDLAPADPELSFLKAHYREHFAEAFAQAVAALEPADRTVLRHRFIDGLTLDQLAAAAGVHRATAARWLARIRQILLEQTRRELQIRLGVGAEEVDSVVRLIASNFEVSVRRLLQR